MYEPEHHARTGERLYFGHGHFNHLGHELTAEVLRRHLAHSAQQ